MNIIGTISPSVFYPAKSAGGFVAGGTVYLKKSSTMYGSTSSRGIFSAWVYPTSVADEKTISGNSDVGQADFVLVSTILGGKFSFWIQGSVGSSSFIFNTVSTYTANSWYHVLASWDTNFSTGNKLKHLYINGVSDVVIDTDGGAFSTNYSNIDDWEVGTDAGLGYLPFEGHMSEFYFSPGTYMDLSVLANRRKLFSAAKRPVSLGADGSLPTGTQPAVYLKGQGPGFNVNSGSGGNYTTTGTLTTPTTTPST